MLIFIVETGVIVYLKYKMIIFLRGSRGEISFGKLKLIKFT